jgi:hypothetical protein
MDRAKHAVCGYWNCLREMQHMWCILLLLMQNTFQFRRESCGNLPQEQPMYSKATSVAVWGTKMS